MRRFKRNAQRKDVRECSVLHVQGYFEIPDSYFNVNIKSLSLCEINLSFD